MIQVKGNCNAFLGGRRCRILNVKTCDNNGDCAFYRTADEVNSSKVKADMRLRALPKIDQQYIAEKYNNGKKLWIKGGERR